ncbi:DUF6884 domain-containing protein [Micromonospora tulbaghiae]|uniref:DUF6884 domain-containing protein n=1 Tax=Micromonospora tulbaghiae TaxID=479978 RepID=UPI003328F52D
MVAVVNSYTTSKAFRPSKRMSLRGLGSAKPAPAPPAPAPPGPAEPPGPGRVLPGHGVVCLDGALPRRDFGNMTTAVVVSVGPKNTTVRVHGEARTRPIPNDLVSLDNRPQLCWAWPPDPRDPPLPVSGRFTHPWNYRAMPHWSWIGWTVAQHLEYARGERPLVPEPVGLGLRRLVIVGCGGKKAGHNTDAHSMYAGSYFTAARRAADKLVGASTGQLILSARYGLLALHDVIAPYDLRMGEPGSVTVEQVRYQAEQLGLADTEEVIVLAGRAYADVVSAVWPHARRPFDGTAGIGEQRQILAAITATGQLPEPKESTVARNISDPKPARPARRAVPKPPSKRPAGGREVPLAGVPWGTYGWIKAMGPDGSPTTETGYITSLPRVYTGGLMSNTKFKDEPILHFGMVDPGRINIGMNAPLGATFTVLPAPDDRPLEQKPCDRHRMPVRDTRAGDLVKVGFPGDGPRWDRYGPELELTEDPREVGDGSVELTGTVAGGPVETFTMPGKEWVSMEGPGVRHLVDDPRSKATTSAGVRDLPPPGETDPVARWRLLGQVSPGFTGVDSRARRARMYAAMRRVHGLAEDASLDEIKAARDAVDCSWETKCEAYWLAYALLMHEEGAVRTAAAEPFPEGEPVVDGEPQMARDRIPAAKWWMLGVVSRIYRSDVAAARWRRMVAAMRRVHGLPDNATMQQIEAAQEADRRSLGVLSGSYWVTYGDMLAEEGAARTIREEPQLNPRPVNWKPTQAAAPAGGKPSTTADRGPVPTGAFIRCGAPACGRKVRVRKDWRIGSHSNGIGKCDRSLNPLPADAKVLVPEPKPKPEPLPFDMDAMAAFFGQVSADLAAAGTSQAAPVVKGAPAAAPVKSAEQRLLERAAARVPADVIEWPPGDVDWPGANAHPYPRVLARYVANGTYVEAEGVDKRWEPVKATGYVVEAHPLRGGYGGRAPEYMTVVKLADYPTTDPNDPSVRMVQVEPGGRVTVMSGPDSDYSGVGYPWVRMPVEQQILAAREQLGLSVRVYDGEHNELWEVEGCPEKLTGEVASWLFGGTYYSWEGRPQPMFAARHVAAALRAGRYRPVKLPVVLPSIRVQPVTIPDGPTPEVEQQRYAKLIEDGVLIDGAGAPLRQEKCWLCLVRRPHQITSGVTCPYAIDCPTCEAKPNQACGTTSGLHDRRIILAQEVDQARAAAGDLSVPAPWPGKAAELRAGQRPVRKALDRQIATMAQQVGWRATPAGSGYFVRPGTLDSGPIMQADEVQRMFGRLAALQEAAATPVNDGPVLDELRAQADQPGVSAVGRESARQAAERYAEGLPLVRRHRALDRAWSWLCPVPSCLAWVDGHDTVRDAKASWLAHAEQHDGFTATWPDDLVPEEPEQEIEQVKKDRKAKRSRPAPAPAAIEVIEPVGNEWWDDAALAWEKCGMLHRKVTDTRSGRQEVAVLSFPQGTAAAVQFEELLATVGGIAPEAMVTYTLGADEVLADEARRDRVDPQPRAAAPVEPAAPPVVEAASDRRDRGGEREALRRAAQEILATCTADVDRDLLAWAAGVWAVGHAHALVQYLSLDSAAVLRGGALGGSLVRGRQVAMNAGGFAVVGPVDGASFVSGSRTIVKVTWKRIAKLIDRAVAADPGLRDRAAAANKARIQASGPGDDAAWSAAQDACMQVMVDLWRSVRPAVAPQPEPEPQLFDLDIEGISAAIAALVSA